MVISNKLTSKITVIPGKIEEINIPEQVDIIISEPMGYMLYNERMLETFLHAKKWLRPGGKMFPTRGDLHIAPFTDAALYMEQLNKANFWYQESFHGVDLTSLRSAAVQEYFRQPIVDTFDVRICMAKSHRFSVDFEVSGNDLVRDSSFDKCSCFNRAQTKRIFTEWTSHSNSKFSNPEKFMVLPFGSTSPSWGLRALSGYRLHLLNRLLIGIKSVALSIRYGVVHSMSSRLINLSFDAQPLFLHKGQTLSGRVVLVSNKRQSYDVELEIINDATGQRSVNTLDLKNPYFRYTGQAPSAPPGTHETSPSEQYWATLDTTQHLGGTMTNNLTGIVNGNGSVLNGSGHGNLVEMTAQVPSNLINHQQAQGLQIAGGGLSSPGGSTNRSSPHAQSRVNSSGAIPVVPSSIGGGISPSVFSATPSVHGLGNSNNFPVSNNLMIGDYATPGNLVMPGQNMAYNR